MEHDAIMAALRSAMPELSSRFGVSGLLLFGSRARGDARADSDVDLLAEFHRPISLFGLASLKLRLEDLLGRPVDIGPLDSVRAEARDQILAEARRVA